MRRYERQSRRPRSYSSPWPRLASMLVMLVVLFMLINRARDPEVWRWLADDRDDDANPAVSLVQPEEKAAPQSKPAGEQLAEGQRAGQPEAAPLAAAGPTDEDPEEIEYMKEAFQAVTDNTLENTSVEMAAYQHLVQWALNQPYELMRRRAQRNVLYTQLLNAPDDYRGKLIRLNLKVVRVLKWDLKVYEEEGASKKDVKPAKIIPVYEAWGTTADSGAHPYEMILVDLPPGMRTGESLEARVRFVGYFFKVQKYFDGLYRPDRAPVLIGRIDWQPTPTPTFQKTDWYITYGFGAAVIAIVLVSLGFALFGRKSRKPGMTLSSSRAATLNVEDWIDEAQGGSPGGADGMNSPGGIEIDKSSPDGRDQGDGKGFPRGLDVDRPPGG